MAGGFTRDGAVQEQIDASVDDAVARARSRLRQNASAESRTHCVDCEREIPPPRRAALPGVQRCVACQETQDQTDKQHALFNRRGSKDSQLR